MANLPVLDAEGLAAGSAALATAIADQPIKQHLIHETVVAELAARRAGTHSTLTRGEVRGGGAKPWRQKGTGRARQGSTRAPHWSGGGIVFGPTPRSYGGKVNRKVRQQAFRAALRAHAERGSAALMDATGWDAPSTKRALEYLRQAPDGLAARPLLVVLNDVHSVEARSLRNIEGVYILAGAELETVDVVAARSVLFERSVWERITREPAEVEAASPAPTRKPAAKKSAPPAPANAVADPEPVTAEKPKRARAKKAAPAAEAEAEATEAELEAEGAELEAPAAEALETEAPEAAADRGTEAEAVEPEAPEAAADEAPRPRPRARGRDHPGRGREVVTAIRDDIRRAIVRPVISEKSFQLVQAHNQYTFRVLDGAHKTEIRQAVEDLFDVTVTDVRTVTVQSKPKRRGATRGRRPGWKKAIVELKPGDKIELFEGA